MPAGPTGFTGWTTIAHWSCSRDSNRAWSSSRDATLCKSKTSAAGKKLILLARWSIKASNARVERSSHASLCLSSKYFLLSRLQRDGKLWVSTCLQWREHNMSLNERNSEPKIYARLASGLQARTQWTAFSLYPIRSWNITKRTRASSALLSCRPSSMQSPNHSTDSLNAALNRV